MNVNSKQKKVIENAVNSFGMLNQCFKAIEEFSELNLELVRKVTKGYSNDQQVIDEIADSFIMLSQLALIYDKNLIQERVDFKIKRLEEFLKKNN